MIYVIKNGYCAYHGNNIVHHITPYPIEKTLTENTMLEYIYVYNFVTFKEKQLKFAGAAENNYIHRITTKHAPSIGNTNIICAKSVQWHENYFRMSHLNSAE